MSLNAKCLHILRRRPPSCPRSPRPLSCSPSPRPLALGRPFSTSTSQANRDDGLRFASDEVLPLSDLPPRAKVVICGGGAQGAAIAYKLAQRGWGEHTVIIDRGKFSKGTTKHSSGMIPLLKASPVETKLAKISRQLYIELEQKGFYTGWRQSGSLYIAQTNERMHYLRRMKSNAVGRDVGCSILSVPEIGDLFPLMFLEDLKGGLYVPEDGVADPVEICLALALLAHQEGGVTLVPHCEILEVCHKNGTVCGVQTDKGYIECENFVNAAGFWARYVGTLAKPRVQIPLHPAEHYVLHTKPLSEFEDTTIPVVRDPDGHIYFRENAGRLLAGSFEPVSKPAYDEGAFPKDIVPGDIVPDWDHFYPSLVKILHRLPFAKKAFFEKLTNDPEPYSPDGEWVLGRASEIRNYFVAAGMRSIGVGAAGGVGELIADYITKGHSPFDMYNLDIQRFLPAHNSRKYLRDRVMEVPGRLFAIPYPFLEYETGRALRTSPIFPKMRDAGARFNQVMGYERPMYFNVAPTSNSLDSEDPNTLDMAVSNTFYRPSWFKFVESEFIASREAVSLCDYSSFAKIILRSKDLEVVNFLQYLCSADVDVPVGTLMHSGMHNENGGYENDCTLARLARNKYLLMSPSIQQMRSYGWMKAHLPTDGSVELEDYSSLYTTLCLMGPLSKAVLKKLSDEEDLNMPPFTVRYLDISCAPDVLTMNLTHTGELGYVFYVPNEFAVHVMDSILEAGEEFKIKQCGYYAMRALRVEKFFAFWGQDLDSQSTPLECGRYFRTKTETDIDFIGKAALKKQKEEGIYKIMVMVLVDNQEHDKDTDPWPWGGEPIFRDDRYVGSITTASYGFSLKKHVAVGFIHHWDEKGERQLVTTEYIKSGQYEIEIAGERYPVKVQLTAPVIPMKVSQGTKPQVYEPTRHEV